MPCGQQERRVALSWDLMAFTFALRAYDMHRQAPGPSGLTLTGTAVALLLLP